MDDYYKMPIEQLEKLLTPRERRFVAELDVDGNGTQAAIRAGYTPGTDNRSAAVAASRLLRKDKIIAYRRARAMEIYKTLGLSPETIAKKLASVYNRCMQAVPVMEWDREEKAWKQTGEWQFDARNALKALELMGKSQGMFVDKVINENRDLTLEEYLAKLE